MRTNDDDPPAGADDDRPPICPACGVTMGIVVDRDEIGHVCLECGYGERPREGRRGAGPDG